MARFEANLKSNRSTRRRRRFYRANDANKDVFNRERASSISSLIVFTIFALLGIFCKGDDDQDVKCPTASEFQTLSPITQPSPIDQMEWLARYDFANKDDHTKKTERVIAKLSNGQIYQSKDNGKTFADETAVLRGFQEDKGFIVDRILVPRDDIYTKRVILQGNKDRHWA